MVEVRLEGVRKRFGRTVAVDGVTLEVRDGEFMVLLGPSGCGKTTTLRIIAGLEKPDEGRVLFGDRDVTRLPPRERNVSMVFQSYAVWPHMTVYDNIAFPLKIRRVPEAEIRRRVRWAAELLGIEELLDRYPAQLSGGQRQRVAVARAIVVEPDVMLMDEPLSNLDAVLRVRMRSELKKLQRRIGVTTIYVTHDQVEAMTMGDRIAVMNRGRIIQVGPPHKVYNEPEDTFVATFIGSPQMNLLEARIEKSPTGTHAVAPGLRIPLPGDPGRDRVLLGIRPEHILLHEAPGTTPVKARIDFVERLGSDTIIHLDLDGQVLVVKVAGDHPLRQGDPLTVYVPREKILIYDPETGKRIRIAASKTT